MLLCACAIPEDTRPGEARVDVITNPELAPAWTVRFGEEFWRRSAPAPGAGIDVGDVIDRVTHAIARDDGGMARVRTRRYAAAFDGVGLRFAPRGDAGELRVHTTAIVLGDQVAHGGSEWSVL